MELLNENREVEMKEKTMTVDTSSIDNERKRGILLIDINHEKMQVQYRIIEIVLVLFL
jgi:hypothetical protein